MQPIVDIEEQEFRAADIEVALTEWYRKNHLAPGDKCEVTIHGILNRVYFRVEHTEEATIEPTIKSTNTSRKAP